MQGIRMKIEDILSTNQLLKLQQSGYAGKSVYVPKIQQMMSKNLIIFRYKKLTEKIKKTSAIKLLAEEFTVSIRNLFRILKNF